MNRLAVCMQDDCRAATTLKEEVLHGLSARPKRIPPKFFYDERGSRLFNAICELPEYYLTRAEMAILRSCAAEVARLAGPDVTLIELGSGASRKVRLLLEAMRPCRYIGVDISREFLLESVLSLARDYPWIEARAVCADIARDFELPEYTELGRRLAFFPGSTIGNFEPHEAVAFLKQVRQLVQPNGALLIGVDLRKDPMVLHRAYNDNKGVTAAFNLNLLRRLRREFSAEFDPDGFLHLAFYNGIHGRIEMHLVSRRAQRIRIFGEQFHFVKGESIHTENSYKYTVDAFQALALRAGFQPREVWLDPQRLFSVHYLTTNGVVVAA